MIYRQILFLKSLAAIRANILVASEKRFAGILYVSNGQSVISGQYDDFGNANLIFNGRNRRIRVVLGLIGELKPLLKLVRDEIHVQRPSGILIDQGHSFLKVN